MKAKDTEDAERAEGAEETNLIDLDGANGGSAESVGDGVAAAAADSKEAKKIAVLEGRSIFLKCPFLFPPLLQDIVRYKL